MRKTIRNLESVFNRKHGYPYVFLNNVPFTEHFKTHIRAMTTAPVSFGLIPKEQWSYPPFINKTQAALNREDMENRNVPYGESESYRHMCRYMSGFIFRHELVQEYDYYWRVEPGVSFSCDLLNIDPFMIMKTKKYKYGFTIALPEFVDTIPTLWENVKRFRKLHPEHIAKRNSLEWISYDKGDTYNNCHFWSNFEIVDTSFFRSKAYLDFFQLLDDAGGFFYERWGDAPVHSIAAALMLDRREIHFFNEIGYRHGMYEHCPESPELQLKCACDPKDNVVARINPLEPADKIMDLCELPDAEDELRAADPDNYDAQRAVFLRHEQWPQRSRVSDLRSRSRRWVVETLFRSLASLDRDDIYDSDWEDEEECKDEDYGFREKQEQEESDLDVGEVEEAKDKESHTLDTILQPASTGSCPWIPQWTWKYNHLQHQQERCRLRRLYPMHDILDKDDADMETRVDTPSKARSPTTASTSLQQTQPAEEAPGYRKRSVFSSFPERPAILVDYLSDPPRLAKSSKGAMDTLLFFLLDLPNGLSSLHQDLASALFVHGPQRIPPHPLLEMAASNILIRLGLLVVLCLGAFYYCVTTMEQQQRQIAGADGGTGSNWLADPAPATSITATNSTSTTASTTGVATTTTESHPRRSLSDLYTSGSGAFTTTGMNMSLGSARRATAGGASTMLTPGMTAAEVMASPGRSVNNLEQLHRQQLQQQSMGGQLLNLTLVNDVQTGPESADSTATAPSTPASITATLISALIRTTATAIALTCGTDNHLHSHVPPYSASTTPTLPCSNVFSGSEMVADGKPGFEPGWRDNARDGDIDHKAQKKKGPQQNVPQPTYKEKQKDIDNNNNNGDDETIYQSEQEFGHFSTIGPFDAEDDTSREYRNMMYYSSNYPPPYSATFGSGGGESSRSNSRRSSIFTPSPSPPVPILGQVAAAAATAVVSHISEPQGLVEVDEKEDEKSPFWTHFYTLDALKSTIIHRISTTATGRLPSVPSHQQQQHGLCSRPSPRQTWTSNKTRSRTRMTRRALSNRSLSISTSFSTLPSASIPSPSSSRSVSVSATTCSTASSRRQRARAARQKSLVQ
ncbi:alpha 1,2-mannosyltransferase 2.4.1 [Linnemannia hyalina]|uniref:Alpha 1,2-mannosyltransferase 2.4.1 n=1 Tax=Linnemannia hyalina TaxID=64524 RepID=A0A9P7XTL3_9FUNG|nr:alpha 1,2-mannosyltransferase 2.4.1 [Linnemannia hyalina]